VARTLYLIKPVEPDSNVTFNLVVGHATTALECYRRSWRSIPEVVKHLTQVGKPFKTYIPRLPLFTGPASVRVCRPLGFRAKGFKFRPHDYTHYEDVRRVFFDLPHSRAAIQAGGIIWRLGVDVLGAEVALRGPSPSAHEFGDIVTSPSGSQFVDDQLTAEEMDMLCGKYSCYTGSSVSLHLQELFLMVESAFRHQTSQKSWWPLQSTFLKSTLWIGYWTSQCEAWYQRRLQDILRGVAQPLTITEWKVELRRRHDTQRIFDAIERASTKYFQQQYSR
jgi:hypothetical protein